MANTPSEVLNSLEQMIKNNNIELRYWAPIESNYLGEAGFFDPDPGGRNVSDFAREHGLQHRPGITLYRTHCKTPGPVLDELLTLAHEYGHYCSWRAKERSAEYETAIECDPCNWSQLSEASKQLIHGEEKRAWAYANETLRTLEFSDWPSFEKRESESMKIYCDKLWPKVSG